jgi:superfamily II DNA or RNA helicase
VNQLSLLSPEPKRKSGTFELRDYQVRADLAIDREFLSRRSTLVCHPTGAGKTVLFCTQALKRGGALVLVHRDTLLRQAAEKLTMATGKEVAIEKGERYAHESPYVVASIQSLHKSRLESFRRRFGEFPLIIIDEAHRATAKSYRNVTDAFPGAKLLGVTATPDRSDGVAMRNVFETVADEYSIIDATADGWLTPLRFHPVEATVNLDGIRVVGSGADRDFDQAELDSAVAQEAGRIAQSAFLAVERSDNPSGRVVVFTPGVKTAHAGAAAMNEIRPGCAVVVDGKMEDVLKRRVLNRFTAGEFQYIWNCNVLSEGFDDPRLYAIFDASPTKSRLRAVQRWGRVTRLWPEGIHTLATPGERRSAISSSPKPWAVVFDLSFNSSEHDVVSPEDILGGKDLPLDIRARAREILRAEGGTVQEAEDRAKEEAESKARRARAAKHMATATSVTLGKPRTVFERAGIEFIRRKKLPTRPEEKITPGMWGLLKSRGIPIPSDCTIPMFKRLLTLDRKQEESGLCSLGDVAWLGRWGVDAWKLPGAAGARIKDATALAGRKLTADEIAPLMERQPGEEG